MHSKFSSGDWASYAECYDALIGLRPYARMLDEVTDIMRDVGGPILDAGCGTGNLTSRLLLEHRNVIGIDACPAMLQIARRKSEVAKFVQINLDEPLSFEEHSFAGIVCSNVLYALENPEDTMGEFFRILRPNGTLLVVTPKRGYENGLILKEHCESSLPDAFWLDAHRDQSREAFLIRYAIPDTVLAERILRIAKINRAIAQERSFHFLEAYELSDLAYACDFEEIRVTNTYASQNLLLVAKRGGYHGNDRHNNS